MNTKETLINARKLIADNGLAYGVFEKGGCFCTVGAIIKTIHNDATMYDDNPSSGNPYVSFITNPKVNAAIKPIKELMNVEHTHEIFNINDTSSKEEILNYFDKAIESL